MLYTPTPHSIFHPVVHLPNTIEVYDFSNGYNPDRILQTEFGIGQYNEHRPSMYTGDLFERESRTIHMGIDIGGPVGTPIHAPLPGVIAYQGYNPEPFDYGHVIVSKHTHHTLGTFWILFGHLSQSSIELRSIGQSFNSGDILGYFGDKSDNGGWNPHLHIQISKIDPKTHDMPGVVSHEQRTQALQDYPDPRLILGDVYP